MIVESVVELIGQRPLPVTTPDATVSAACASIAARDVGAMVVMDGADLVGVLSKRDVIAKCVCRHRMTSDVYVREIMTERPRIVSPETPVVDALRIMIAGGFHHLPVVENGRVLGLVAMKDIPVEYRLMLERYDSYMQTQVSA